MASGFYATHLFLIPLGFAFTIHIIASRYYMNETKFEIDLDYNIDSAYKIMTENEKSSFKNCLPVFTTGAKEINEKIYDLPFFKNFNFGLLGGRGTVTLQRKELIFMNNGKTYVVQFLVDSHNFKAEYEFLIMPREKDSKEKLTLVLKSYVDYNSLFAKGLNKLMSCMFEKRQKEALAVCKGYIENHEGIQDAT